MLITRLFQNLRQAILRQFNENEEILECHGDILSQIRKEQLEQRSDLEDIKVRLIGSHSLLGTVRYDVITNKDEIMSTIQEVFTSLDSTLNAILTQLNSLNAAVASEAAELQTLITGLQNNQSGATPADLQAIIDRLAAFNVSVGEGLSTATDSIAALSLSVPTPTVPTPPEEPTPVEPSPDSPVVPVEELPFPDVELPIDVEPTEPGIGVDGGFELVPNPDFDGGEEV